MHPNSQWRSGPGGGSEGSHLPSRIKVHASCRFNPSKRVSQSPPNSALSLYCPTSHFFRKPWRERSFYPSRVLTCKRFAVPAPQGTRVTGREGKRQLPSIGRADTEKLDTGQQFLTWLAGQSAGDSNAAVRPTCGDWGGVGIAADMGRRGGAQDVLAPGGGLKGTSPILACIICIPLENTIGLWQETVRAWKRCPEPDSTTPLRFSPTSLWLPRLCSSLVLGSTFVREG